MKQLSTCIEHNDAVVRKVFHEQLNTRTVDFKFRELDFVLVYVLILKQSLLYTKFSGANRSVDTS